MITLRPYQEAAKAAVYDHLRHHDDNPCVVMPTGSGKSPLLASICHDAVSLWNGRVLILAHVKELLEQSAEKLRAVCPELKFGIYSAGLKRRDKDQPVIVAGIQSVYKRACELDAFDLIIVDEAHMISPEGDTMYRQFIADARVVNPNVRIIGLTATPFRLKDGPICTDDGILNRICYEVGIRELIRDGFLSPLVTKSSRHKVDTSHLPVRGGEFVAGEAQTLMDDEELVIAACEEIVEQCADRRSVLIFAAGVQHGQHVQRVLQDEHGVECGFVCGKTPASERDETLRRFREGGLKYLSNVNVLTTGFDAPGIDCVAMLRPTMSTGLYYQMVGRGFRLAPGKQDCLVLDFGGNILRHGPVDELRVEPVDRRDGLPPAKECPECRSIIATGFATCPDCGYEFPPPERQKHDSRASTAGILADQVSDRECEVLDIAWTVHTKRQASADAPRTMRVEYQLGLDHWQSEWVCFEHDGYARQKAIAWWRRRSVEPIPETSEEAVHLAQSGALATTNAIVVRSVAGERFDRIVGYQLGPVPPALATMPVGRSLFDEEDVPF